MTVLNSLWAGIAKPAQTPTIQTRRVHLDGRAAHSLPARGQTLHMVSGRAWVTLDGQDLIALTGEHVTLTKSSDIAVISALGERPLVFEIR